MILENSLATRGLWRNCLREAEAGSSNLPTPTKIEKKRPLPPVGVFSFWAWSGHLEPNKRFAPRPAPLADRLSIARPILSPRLTFPSGIDTVSANFTERCFLPHFSLSEFCLTSVSGTCIVNFTRRQASSTMSCAGRAGIHTERLCDNGILTHTRSTFWMKNQTLGHGASQENQNHNDD